MKNDSRSRKCLWAWKQPLKIYEVWQSYLDMESLVYVEEHIRKNPGVWEEFIWVELEEE